MWFSEFFPNQQDEIYQKDLLGLPRLFPVPPVGLWHFHIWRNSSSSAWQLFKSHSEGFLHISFFWFCRQPGVSTSVQKATPIYFSWNELHCWLWIYERGERCFLQSLTSCLQRSSKGLWSRVKISKRRQVSPILALPTTKASAMRRLKTSRAGIAADTAGASIQESGWSADFCPSVEPFTQPWLSRGIQTSRWSTLPCPPGHSQSSGWKLFFSENIFIQWTEIHQLWWHNFGISSTKAKFVGSFVDYFPKVGLYCVGWSVEAKANSLWFVSSCSI